MKYQVKVVACTVLILISKKDNNINKGTRGTQRYKQQLLTRHVAFQRYGHDY